MKPPAASSGSRTEPSAAPDKAGAGPAVPEGDGEKQGCGFLEPQEKKAVSIEEEAAIDAEAAAIDAEAELIEQEAAFIGADPLDEEKRPFDPEAFQEPEGGSGNG